MNAIPGTLQEGGAVFASTHWSVVLLAAQDEAPEAAQAALGALCQSYWPPLYTFLRRRGYAPADAQDLVQGFFVSLLEQNSLRSANREKGRLRAFLLGSLQHYLANEHDRARALKRGGGQQIVSLDEHFEMAEAALGMHDDADPAASYDRAWAVTLLDRAWEHLRAACAAEGKERWLNEVKPLLMGGLAPPPNQEQLAAKLNMHPSTLRTALQRLRQRYREALRGEVARTVSGQAEIDEEVTYLYRVLIS
jgi:RNA polymerase sigma factor (sigma-70 family)